MAEAAAAGCEVFEYSPSEVKQAVTGWGRADKQQVGEMVQTLLRLPKLLRPAGCCRRGSRRALPPGSQPARRLRHRPGRRRWSPAPRASGTARASAPAS